MTRNQAMKQGPLSEVARQVLETEEQASARVVNRVRYVIGIMFSGPLVLISLQSIDPAALTVNLGSILLYLLITVGHSFVIRNGQIRLIRLFNWLALFADILLACGMILYWTLSLSPESFTFAVKTTVWYWVSLILAGTALQFDRKLPIVAIVLCVLIYAAMGGIMLYQGVESTGDWREYINGNKVDLGDVLFTKPLVFVLIGLVSAYSIRHARSMVNSITSAESKRALLSRYFSPSVVDDITSDDSEATRACRQVATILFMDIRNFTQISESQDPETLLNWLSDLRGRLTRVVFKYSGSVDKFIGDAIMATFGIPRPSESPGQDATNAVLCAREMLQVCKELDATWARYGITNAIGIGIHSGEVFAGNVGDSDQIEYTVIGDPVNTASRIEGLCKKLDRNLIISRAVKEQLLAELPLEKLPRVRVKGKELPLELYSVSG